MNENLSFWNIFIPSQWHNLHLLNNTYFIEGVRSLSRHLSKPCFLERTLFVFSSSHSGTEALFCVTVAEKPALFVSTRNTMPSSATTSCWCVKCAYIKPSEEIAYLSENLNARLLRRNTFSILVISFRARGAFMCDFCREISFVCVHEKHKAFFCNNLVLVC